MTSELDARKARAKEMRKKIYARLVRPGILSGTTIDLTSMDRRMLRLARRRDAFQSQITTTLENKAKYGLSSYWIERLRFTEAWLRLALLLGRECVYCKRTDVWDPSWRLVLKDDPCYCLPHKAWAYEKALKEGVEKVELWCPTCHNRLWKQVRIWLFSPNCPRRYPLTSKTTLFKNWPPLDPEQVPFGPFYARMWEFVKHHYPSNDAELRKQNFPHLLCHYDDLHTGSRIPRPSIRTKPGPWNWHNMIRSLFQPLVEEAGLYYLNLFPNADVDQWGHFSPRRRAYYRREGTFRSFLSPEFKDFLSQNPPLRFLMRERRKIDET